MERAYAFSEISGNETCTVEMMKNAGWISAMIAILLLWHHGGMKQSPEEMHKMIFEMFHIGNNY